MKHFHQCPGALFLHPEMEKLQNFLIEGLVCQNCVCVCVRTKLCSLQVSANFKSQKNETLYKHINQIIGLIDNDIP
jgi:hypothetical protein